MLRLWDIERQQVKDTITGQFTGYTAVVFSPDDTRLVAGGNDGTITVWDVETRQQVARWKAHDQACYWLRFVASDQGLVSLGDCSELDRFQGEIRLWRAPLLREIELVGRNR